MPVEAQPTPNHVDDRSSTRGPATIGEADPGDPGDPGVARSAAAGPTWVTPSQLLGPSIYEALRRRCVAEFVALRGRRRLRLTPSLSVLFEGRETVLLQVYEVLRAEGWDPARARRELAGYACLVPGPGRLCATAMIDGGDPALGRRLAAALRRRGALHIRHGSQGAASEPAEPTADDGPVHYLRFPIDRGLAAAIVGGGALTLAVDDHAAGRAVEVSLPLALCRELARDLASTPTPTPLLSPPCGPKPAANTLETPSRSPNP